jgi:hypothetical protein
MAPALLLLLALRHEQQQRTILHQLLQATDSMTIVRIYNQVTLHRVNDSR